jgi:arginyl-tRNA synthetase
VHVSLRARCRVQRVLRAVPGAARGRRRRARLAARVLECGLGLLGIESPEQM